MIVGRNVDRLAAAVEEIESLESDGGSIRYEPADVTNETKSPSGRRRDGVARTPERSSAQRGGSLTVGQLPTPTRRRGGRRSTLT